MNEFSAVDLVIIGTFIAIVLGGFFVALVYSPKQKLATVKSVVSDKKETKTEDNKVNPKPNIIVTGEDATVSKSTALSSTPNNKHSDKLKKSKSSNTVSNLTATFPLATSTIKEPKNTKPAIVPNVPKKRHNVPDDVVNTLSAIYQIPKEIQDLIPLPMWHVLDDMYCERMDLFKIHTDYVMRTQSVLMTLQAGITFGQQELGAKFDGQSISNKPKK